MKQRNMERRNFLKRIAAWSVGLLAVGKLATKSMAATQKPAGLVPIGGVIAWLKSFSNVPALPDEYVELNGQVLSDAQSPLNGQTLPNLETSSELCPALTSAYWTEGTGWTFGTSPNTLIKSSDGTGTAVPTTPLTIVGGTTYKVVITLSAWSVGSATYTLGGTSAGTSTLNSKTTYDNYVVATNSGNLIITPSNTSRFTISAISVTALQQRFIRFSATSGSTGGYDNAFSYPPVTGLYGVTQVSASAGIAQQFDSGGIVRTSLPPYYEAVPIMRIK
jgi:hypothetical protein